MESTDTPLLYQSPGSTPANWPLPPTPEDGDEAHDELYVLAQLPTLPHRHSTIGHRTPAVLQGHQRHASSVPWLPASELKDLESGLASKRLSGNVLGKRPVSGPTTSPQEPPLKSIRVSTHENFPIYDVEAEDIVDDDLHIDIGVIDKKHSCACGKSYTRAFRLRQHIEIQSSNSKFPCLVCGAVFLRLDSLRRHEGTKHEGKKVACPGCDKEFRPDYLHTHLRSSQNAKCKVVAHALYFQSDADLESDSRLSAENYWIPMIVENIKQRSLQANAMHGVSSTQAEPSIPEPPVKTPQRNKLPQTQPIQRKTRPPCDICHLPLGPGEKELIDHIGEHSLDFMFRKFRCDECDVGFAYRGDLEMHLEAAATGHCGFNFDHGTGRQCKGHHPRYIQERMSKMHRRMEETLWVWEDCQLLSSRTTIVRLLAERLKYTQAARRSIANDDCSPVAVLTRLSIGSIHSFLSVPAWMEYQDKVDMDELETQMSNMDLQQDGAGVSEDHQDNFGQAVPRPSLPVQGAAGTVDFTMSWENGQFKPVIKGTTASAPARLRPESIAVVPDSRKSLYVDQLKSLRSPGGLKRTASGVRYRARAAARHLMPVNESAQGTLSIRHLGTAPLVQVNKYVPGGIL